MKKLQLKDEAGPLVPPIKWAGGKRWLAPEIARLFAASGAKRLVEPFCGACSVALGVRPRAALLNDANPDLIAFWQVLASGGKLLDVGGNSREDFERARAEFNRLDSVTLGDSPQKRKKIASLFYYLNRTCFNGLYRVNSKGEYNVPFGKYKTISYQQEFPEISEAIRGWKFVNHDFSALATYLSDFVYADPPYDAPFVQFASGGFGWDDQVRLATWLSEQPGTVVASNAATPRIVELYKDCGFTVTIIDAPRRISCNGNREKAKEIFAIRSRK